MIKDAVVLEELYCTRCEGTTVHYIYIGATTNGLRVVVTKQCQSCKQAAGRIV